MVDLADDLVVLESWQQVMADINSYLTELETSALTMWLTLSETEVHTLRRNWPNVAELMVRLQADYERRRMTWLELARSIAAEFRVVLTDDAAGLILWEYTGFPAFWRGDPRTTCTRQLREYFERTVSWG